MKTFFDSAESLKQALPRGKTFTLIGGCFDLLHVGHVHALEEASKLEDLLVAAVLSDRYARSYKNSGRPILNQKQRAAVVANLRFVDYVFIADESPSSAETLSTLKPDSVVFGEEAGKESKIRQRMLKVKKYSPLTKIKLLPRYKEDNISTSQIISKVRHLENAQA